MELNEIIEMSNRVATEKGFWEDYDNLIKKMKGLNGHFSETDIERIKLAFYNEKISLISSELGEATEAMRINKFYKGGEEGLRIIFDLLKEDDVACDKIQFQGAFLTHVKDTFEDEIADSFIRLCDLCSKMNIDIEKFIQLKMEYNKCRNSKHGKKF